MKAVHHFNVCAQVLLGEVVQHARIHQTLHEVAAVLRQTQTRQPLVPYPFVIHVSICQCLRTTWRHFHNLIRETLGSISVFGLTLL